MRDENLDSVREDACLERGELVADPSSDTPSQKSAAAHLALAGLAVATAACGGGGGSGGGSSGSGGTPAPTVVKPQTDAEAARFLLQAGFAASTGEIAQVRSEGYEPWLDRQMSLANDESGEAFLKSRGFDTVDANEWYFRTTPADNMVWRHLLHGNSAVRRRVALALSEFFVVSLNSIEITWRSQAMGFWWDNLNQHTFGSFRSLLEAVTLNPAMGVYLNTLGNRKADPRTGRVADENYGREVMQLFTIGLHELNIDGSVRTNSSGAPIETYTNEDVTGIAKSFTGYDYDYTGIAQLQAYNQTYTIPHPDYVRRPMTADPAKWRTPRTTGYHSDEEKRFLGTTIPAGTNAAETLRITLDTLFNHPNVGPFFGEQMIQRLVTSNPSRQYVQRVAEVFNNNGRGQRGDLKAVFKAILLDSEARSASGLTDPRFGKLREPMLRVAQWGRTFGAASASGAWGVGNVSDPATRLGQSPLRSPSVFNFFRPGYVPAGSYTATNNMLAPEFQLVNETSVAGYVNLIERTIDGTGSSWMGDVKAAYAGELAMAHDAPVLLDRLNLLLTANQLSQASRDLILPAMNDVAVTQTSDDATKLRRIYIGVLLVMASNEYLVQK